MLRKIKNAKWKIEPSITSEWFDDKMDDFTHFGRDIEQFFSKIKICHAKRIFGKMNIERKLITKEDLQNAFKKFKKKNDDEDDNELYLKMYT